MFLKLFFFFTPKTMGTRSVIPLLKPHEKVTPLIRTPRAPRHLPLGSLSFPFFSYLPTFYTLYTYIHIYFFVEKSNGAFASKRFFIFAYFKQRSFFFPANKLFLFLLILFCLILNFLKKLPRQKGKNCKKKKNTTSFALCM